MAEHDHNAATNALTNAKEQLASLREQEAFIKSVLTKDEQAELLLKRSQTHEKNVALLPLCRMRSA